jgi:hypothetical protein
VRRGVGRLVQIDDTRLDVLLQRTLQRRVTGRNRRVVTSANVQLVIVLRNTIPR